MPIQTKETIDNTFEEILPDVNERMDIKYAEQKAICK
jgi:hypothetical protein